MKAEDEKLARFRCGPVGHLCEAVAGCDVLAGDIARPDVAFDVSVGLDDVCGRRVVQTGALEVHMRPGSGNTERDKRQKKCRDNDSFLLHRIAPFVA